MPKENIKKSMGVFAAVFAHTGHITKDEAREMSGLDKDTFEKLYDKAGKVAKKMQAAESNKIESFLNHLGDEIDDYMKKFFI